MTADQIREDVAAYLASLGVTYTATFVPFSKSRNANPDAKRDTDYSINWKVKLARRFELETDYTQGIGHIPEGWRGTTYNLSIYEMGRLKNIVESGKWGAEGTLPIHKLQPPHVADVLHSLVLEYGVLDYPAYEAWAAEYGYDPDSRKGERIYRDCIDLALKLRGVFDEAEINHLRKLLEGY